MTPLLLCSAAFLTLPGALFAQSTQEQPKQPAAQSQPQAPAAAQSQAPSSAQPQRDEQKSGASQSGTQTQTQGQAPSSGSATPSTAQQPSQDQKGQSPASSGQQQTQSPASSGQNEQSPQRSGTSQQSQTPSTSGTQTTQTPKTGTSQQNAQQPSATGQAAGQSGGQTASLSDQQRTKISTSISQANVQPLRNVNFTVNVGTAVPPSVRFYPVTRAMIDVYPQYRGYSFVVVSEEIIIIEPRTRKIVQVIPHQSGGQATLRSRLKLSDQQRNVIRSSVRRSSTPATTGSSTTIEKEITIGDSVPDTIVIERFPDTVYRQVPSMRSYQYIARDRGVYVIDPRERRVIDLID
jgi:hypothetical protein